MLDVIEARSIPEPNSGCWLWLGSGNGVGYGQIKRRGRMLLAHRVAWEAANGPIPSNAHVCHRCDNRVCVNPNHLFVGSNADNVADRVRKGRSASGPRHGMAGRGLYGQANGMCRLSDADVVAIRAAPAAISQRALAKQFGVTQGTIWRILHGKAHIAALRARA